MKLNKKTIERGCLLGSAMTLFVTGLFWNLYSDIVMKMGSLPLILGVITSILGGVGIFAGASLNNFEVKTPGIVLISIGSVLAAAFAVIPVTPAIGKYEVYTIVCMVLVILAVVAAVTGLVLQILRKNSNED